MVNNHGEKVGVFPSLVTIHQVSNEKKGPWLLTVYAGDDMLPSYCMWGLFHTLGGGFKDVLFLPLFGDDEPNLTSIFFKWVATTN